jgi:hypothetical protein
MVPAMCTLFHNQRQSRSTSMATYSVKDIRASLQAFTHTGEPVTLQTSLQDDLGIWGDDLDEFLTLFASRYQVDMSKYLWYFHTQEEGVNFGASIHKSPDQLAPYIPITVQVLHDSANCGEWSVVYPKHTVPKRMDLAVSRAIVAIIFCGIILYVVWRILW